jgi:hypothetical protein
MGSAGSTPARAAPRAREQSIPGITVALPEERQPHTRTLLGPYTDGGPFVYTPPIAAPENTAVELRVEYIDAYLGGSETLSPKPYTTVRIERSEAVLSARLMAPVRTALDAYLIARSVFHLAADGHFGALSEVRFHGFDAARRDVERLEGSTMPTWETEQAIRAMPARGPCVLDRLAEWQLDHMEAVFSREFMYRSLCRFIRNYKSNTGNGDEATRIPVFSAETAKAGATDSDEERQRTREEVEFARRHIEGTVRGRRLEGRLFLEPFLTPDGATSIVSWIDSATAPEMRGHDLSPLRGGSLASVVSPDFGRRVASALRALRTLMHKKQVAYPAADPIAVYVRESRQGSQHWLLHENKGSGGVVYTRAWVHLPPRVYLFGVQGSRTEAPLGVLRMFSAMCTPPGARGAIDAAAEEWARSESQVPNPKEATNAANAAKAAREAWARVQWTPPEPMRLEESTTRARAWRASGLFAVDMRHARVLLSTEQLTGTRGIVVTVTILDHDMCGFLTVSRRASGATATLLVRNSYPGSVGTELASQFNQGPDEEIPLTVEYVKAPDSHYTQELEGSCGYHAMMFAVYLLDVAPEAVRSGDVGRIFDLMKTFPPPLYALVVRRILVYYVREDNLDDFPSTPGTVGIRLESARVLNLGAREPGARERAEKEATTALGLSPVSVRLPGVLGALVSFRFLLHDSPYLYARVDACVDSTFGVVLVLGSTVNSWNREHEAPRIDRCLAFARHCVSMIYPGQLISGPALRNAGVITAKRYRPI